MSVCGFIELEHMRMFLGLNGVAPRKPGQSIAKFLVKGDRKGTWSIRVNHLWRVSFRFEGGNVYDVEIVDCPIEEVASCVKCLTPLPEKSVSRH